MTSGISGGHAFTTAVCTAESESVQTHPAVPPNVKVKKCAPFVPHPVKVSNERSGVANPVPSIFMKLSFLVHIS